MIDKNRMYENLKRLVAVPSVSGTKAEGLAADELEKMLYEIPYFAQHREQVRMIAVEEDALGRKIVAAYLECCPESRKTVILTGHYDVVDVEEYGHLREWAYDIETISRRIDEMPLDEDSRKDFESGEWIFGRGATDMKFGLVLGLELLHHYAEEGGINGNLLYVAVCGEETNSEGMLQAVPFFNRFAAEKDIEYEGLLLSECYMMEDQAKNQDHYVHLGSSGKIMPMFFCVGEATHMGEPFLGLDPILLLSEIYKRMQLNPAFCQRENGVMTPPPSCLKNTDLKENYSVSTPLYGASYYSMVTLSMDPERLLEMLMEIAEESFCAALDFMEARKNAYGDLCGIKPVSCEVSPCVKTYAQLCKEARSSYSGDFDREMALFMKTLREEGKELQDVAVQAVKRVYELSSAKGPMIVVSIIPPYYPDVFPDQREAKTAEFLRCLEDTLAYAKARHGESVKLKNYYMGICDLAYTGLDPEKDFDAVFENLIGAGQMYGLPVEEMKAFRVPGIVLGGYGKDFHKHTERLHKGYSFDVLPDLYLHLIQGLLK